MSGARRYAKATWHVLSRCLKVAKNWLIRNYVASAFSGVTAVIGLAIWGGLGWVPGLATIVVVALAAILTTSLTFITILLAYSCRALMRDGHRPFKTALQLPSRCLSAVKNWLVRTYVALAFAGVTAVVGLAIWGGLWQVPGLANGLLGQLKIEHDSDKVRGIVVALAAILATITIFGTLVAQVLRIWINERTAQATEHNTRTAEANLVTGLINTAVEGLGAEKRVSRIGRPVAVTRDGEVVETVIEWQGEAGSREQSNSYQPGEWKSFESTAPNIEVRIGAILTLERISHEFAGEHIRVMQILCAYIRQNAPASDAWRQPADRAKPPRADITVALNVIGCRPDERKRREASDKRGGRKRYRLDLGLTNLRHCDLSGLDFCHAVFSGSHLEGAQLKGTHLAGAELFGAHLEDARLDGAHLERARLDRAHLERAWLHGAHLTDAWLSRSHLENALLVEAHLEGAHLDWAHLKGALLGVAHFEGAVLDNADLRAVHWAGVTKISASAYGADFRGAIHLTQAMLEGLVGDENTLLPEGNAPDTGEPWYVWTWHARGSHEPQRKAGMHLPLDAPYPKGHPREHGEEAGAVAIVLWPTAYLSVRGEET